MVTVPLIFNLPFTLTCIPPPCTSIMELLSLFAALLVILPPFILKVPVEPTYTPPPWDDEVLPLIVAVPLIVNLPTTYTPPPQWLVPLAVLLPEIIPPDMLNVAPLTMYTPPPLTLAVLPLPDSVPPIVPSLMVNVQSSLFK